MNDKFRFGELKACIILGVLPLKCIIYGVLYMKKCFCLPDKRGLLQLNPSLRTGEIHSLDEIAAR